MSDKTALCRTLTQLQLNGTPFVTPRRENQSVYVPLDCAYRRLTDAQHSFMYRIRPSVAHKGYTALPDNPDVGYLKSAVYLKLTCRIARGLLFAPQPQGSF